jgi:hypothetical protein
MANEVAAILQAVSNYMADGGEDRRSRGRRVTLHPPQPFSTHDHAADVKARSQHAHVPQCSFLSPLWRKNTGRDRGKLLLVGQSRPRLFIIAMLVCSKVEERKGKHSFNNKQFR